MNAALAAILAAGGCVQTQGLRPLHPLEIATSPYSETITSSHAGSLAYEGRCLLFRESGTRGWLLPVWPTGSTFNGTAVIFHQPGKAEQPILLAQQFVISGRSLPWNSLAAAIYAPFQRECGGEPFLVSKVRPAD